MFIEQLKCPTLYPSTHSDAFMKLKLLVIMAIVLLMSACQKQPDFQYADGKAGNYDDFSGKWLVINYWATWCKPCIEEIPELNKLSQRADIQVVGINFDRPQQAVLQTQIQELNIQFPVLQANAHTHYQFDYPSSLPMTVIIDANGNIRHKLLGPQTFEKLLEYMKAN